MMEIQVAVSVSVFEPGTRECRYQLPRSITVISLVGASHLVDAVAPRNGDRRKLWLSLRQTLPRVFLGGVFKEYHAMRKVLRTPPGTCCRPYVCIRRCRFFNVMFTFRTTDGSMPRDAHCRLPVTQPAKRICILLQTQSPIRIPSTYTCRKIPAAKEHG